MAVFTEDRLIMHAVAQFCEALHDDYVCYRGRTWYVDISKNGTVHLIAVDGREEDPPLGITLDPGEVVCAVAAGEMREELAS